MNNLLGKKREIDNEINLVDETDSRKSRPTSTVTT